MLDTLSNKEVWDVTEQDFTRAAGGHEKMRFLLRYAVLAPSSHNTQPWKFKISGDDTIEIYADESRRLKIADADRRELFISIGCALENLLIAAEHFGYETAVDYFPQAGDEGFVARVRFETARKQRETVRTHLFEVIPERSTFHGAFADAHVSDSILRAIHAYAEEPGINLFLTRNEEIRSRVDDLIVRSDEAQFADPAFRRELAFWIGQGAFGNGWLMSQIGSLAVAYLNLGKSTAKTDEKVLRSAPVLGLITSAENDRVSQVKTGQVFERIYLSGHKHKLGVRPMSQIVQIPKHKEELKQLVPQCGDFPQQPFLLGYCETTESHTPRRKVEEVLMR